MNEEELTRVLTKIDSCIHLMQNGKLIHAYEKINGIRQIILNMIIEEKNKTQNVHNS